MTRFDDFVKLGRGGRCRAFVYGFGDRYSTVEIRPHKKSRVNGIILSLFRLFMQGMLLAMLTKLFQLQTILE